MSSVRLVIVTESTADVFLTETANVTVPPGSWIEAGFAVFVDRDRARHVRDRDRRVVVTRDLVAVVVGA